ncbi:MAG: MBL fold metallo-hydrolase [Candidatus Riflebacteria bacterium]|nr:MBL fold metallo-hydrolase [Candidatus Riflebacteria bacterium]
MKVITFTSNPNVYSCNAYLVLGSWNTIDDVNTLVDTGTDAWFLDQLPEINTGVGKKPVQQVVLTHCHFDHAGGIKKIRDKYKPEVLAYSTFEGADRHLKGGETIRMGDSFFEVIHFPGHSQDSICFYSQSEKTLFSGDVQLFIRTPGGTYLQSYVDVLCRIVDFPIARIFSGHDKPYEADESEIRKHLLDTLANVRNSEIHKNNHEGERYS